jgi:hypothetical protein
MLPSAIQFPLFISTHPSTIYIDTNVGSDNVLFGLVYIGQWRLKRNTTIQRGWEVSPTETYVIRVAQNLRFSK